MIARAKGDSARATAAFREAREILAQRLVMKPEHARTIAVLAQAPGRIGSEGSAHSGSATRDRSDADFERYLRWRVGPGRSRPGVRVERRPRSRDWVGTETRDDAWLHQLRPPEITPALESPAGRSAI